MNRIGLCILRMLSYVKEGGLYVVLKSVKLQELSQWILTAHALTIIMIIFVFCCDELFVMLFIYHIDARQFDVSTVYPGGKN